MAKYRGPKLKLARREGADLFLKSGLRSIEDKCKLDQLPGQHGAGGKRGRLSDYAMQLREKQKLRRTYGVAEKQFRSYYKEAVRRKESTGTNLLQILECRLDNVVYRIGFGSTRADARQLVGHKHIQVNGKTVNIPSYQLKAGDVVSVRERAKTQSRIKFAMELAGQTRDEPDWIDTDSSNMNGTFKSVPLREELPSDINEHLIVELYSK